MNRVARRRFVGSAAVVTGGIAVAWRPRSAAAAETGGVDAKTLRDLRGKLQGRLVLADDPSYDEDRRVFYLNPRTETRPVAIVRCGHEEDVPRAVEFARRHRLEIAVRSGGHSHLAWGSSNGVVIDLSPL